MMKDEKWNVRQYNVSIRPKSVLVCMQIILAFSFLTVCVCMPHSLQYSYLWNQ
jgi:hypothetical protein